MAGPPSVAAFVRASLVRMSVIAALLDWPKTTGQLAEASGISAAHASRAVRELSDRGLVECLTPDRRGRGRMYDLTGTGKALASILQWRGRQPLMIPMIRATHPRAWSRVFGQRFGEPRARPAFAESGLARAVSATAQRWVPLRSMMRLFEEVEARFGDGTYGCIRQVAAEAVAHFPSVRRFLMRALPVRVLADLAPAVYLREFNHGRMEVESSEGRAHFKQFDWLSSPARCQAWLGTYEGAFALRKVRAQVRKVECLLKGDEYCGYIAEWRE
ncbi:MAG TPA: winged helix-turn-helix domain-containing protein [Thermoplasmata archaeon]|nr:winged helix-turn-helix domain-containing protein [Thermoplasmata archaeon]